MATLWLILKMFEVKKVISLLGLKNWRWFWFKNLLLSECLGIPGLRIPGTQIFWILLRPGSWKISLPEVKSWILKGLFQSFILSVLTGNLQTGLRAHFFGSTFATSDWVFRIPWSGRRGFSKISISWCMQRFSLFLAKGMENTETAESETVS